VSHTLCDTTFDACRHSASSSPVARDEEALVEEQAAQNRVAPLGLAGPPLVERREVLPGALHRRNGRREPRRNLFAGMLPVAACPGDGVLPRPGAPR
jgi:hypothetical protein